MTTQIDAGSITPGQGAPDRGSAASRFEQRIGQITREKHEALRALAEMKERYGNLESEVASIKQSLAAQPANGAAAKHKDWSDLTEAELLQIGEEYGASNPAYNARILKELARREADKVRAELRQEYEGSKKADTLKTSVMQRIATEFGPGVLKADSPLRQKAIEVAQEFAALYGAKEVQSSALNEYLIFAEAARRLGATQAPAQTDDSERLRAAAKSREVVEAGVNAAASSSASLKNLVSRGDVRGALRQLDIVRGLRGEEPKGAEPDASSPPPL